MAYNLYTAYIRYIGKYDVVDQHLAAMSIMYLYRQETYGMEYEYLQVTTDPVSIHHCCTGVL